MVYIDAQIASLLPLETSFCAYETHQMYSNCPVKAQALLPDGQSCCTIAHNTHFPEQVKDDQAPYL